LPEIVVTTTAGSPEIPYHEEVEVPTDLRARVPSYIKSQPEPFRQSWRPIFGAVAPDHGPPWT
jgi:hypothetical protein